MPGSDTLTGLVRRAQQGDTGVYVELVRAYLRPAYVIALAVVDQPADAEAIAQDELWRALVRIKACGEANQFISWLFQNVRKRARNFLCNRRLGRAPAIAGSGELDSLAPELAGVRDAVLSALRVLDEAKREVVLLYDLEGWSHWQIADALGISETNSRRQLLEARRILQCAGR
jgi:RNA polymerase sigma-70 factor (ECF subfamily)